MLLIGTIFVFLLAGHQQQVARAWWFSASNEQTKPPVAVAVAGARAFDAPLRAVANFDMDGVRGFVKFSQKGPNDVTLVEYDLAGLKGNNKLYHVHMRPVPKFDVEKVRNNASAIAQLCGDPATGGHLNPHHITEKLPPKSAPFDKYELGDLSGKHGPFLEVNGQPDHYVGSYTDDKLPMSGEHSILGRSVVIHKSTGPRWVCASIEPSK